MTDRDSIESTIEQTFVRFLGTGADDGSRGKIVGCEEVEREVFGKETGGGKEKSESRTDNGSVKIDGDECSDDSDNEGGVTLPSPTTSLPKSTFSSSQQPSPPPPPTPQSHGLKLARQREQVRQAARRGVAFGFLSLLLHNNEQMDKGKEGTAESMRRKVEAVQSGRVVEASFAKGEWGVRWRE